MSIEIGNAYNFSDIAGNDQVLWTCLSRNSVNDQIMNLVSTVSERPVSPAAEVQSDDGGKAWLVPAISIAVHRRDLEPRTIASHFELIPADLDVESLLATDESTDEAILDLHMVGWTISQYFHANPDRQVVPDIQDCVLLDENVPSGSIVFAWRDDKNRRYALQIGGGNRPSLQQEYDPGDELRWPADAPLKVGSTTIRFSSEGSTLDKLNVNEVDAIKVALGLEAEKSTGEVSRRSGILESLLSGWKLTAAAAVLAGIAATVLLMQQADVPAFDVYRAYATTEIRGDTSVQPGIILELRAADVTDASNYFENLLSDAGIAVTVEQLPGEGILVTGNGRIDASDGLRKLLTTQDIDVDGREFIEIAIQPVE